MTRLYAAVLLVASVCAGCSAQKSPTKLLHSQAKEACKEGDTQSAFEDTEGKIGYSWGLGDQGSPLVVDMVCKQGKWIKDEAATQKRRAMEAAYEARERAKEKHNHDLWNALRTRVITDPEMKEVLELGTAIIPESEGGHTRGSCWGGCTEWEALEAHKMAATETILNNALLNQFKMRTFAAGQE